MAQCELSGKAPVTKNLVSHSNIKTKSKAFPNIQSKRLYSLVLKRFFKFKLSTSALKNIDKAGGLDIFIVRQEDSRLSPRALRLKKQILKKNRTTKTKKGNRGENETQKS